ncbi:MULTISPECIES: efflux RND transporter permease subunit [unclassified Bacteroides]|jgi:HAE1 family hydrophobic/amphiphilic exporter-1|uniref:efflux RND transporter permease subunit n=1 Tax=unclassified Bacteroides TaxID=2646097 RepID=UPI000E81C2A5|nr:MULTISPECIES: efflux RND transporter permease subunit [unclassified Bacteroides]RGN49853.1 AcrB/AcrD/AcrF family protein [Bacteroides sp. OM05-12]RHR81449.1 AcrB/AcrD/AcrF family protein [Bacteroides sp. AF16-49]
MSLYEGSVKRPIMTSLVFLAVVIFGLFSLQKLPIDLYPDIETNTLMVMTAYPGASAADVENNVSRPMENVLNTVSNLKHITSKSRENISVITMEFEFGEDIDVLTNDVRDKLEMVKSSLPDDAESPIIFKFSTDMIPIVLLSVQAEQSLPALYKILDDGVANPLARIGGVGTVSISGAPQREVQVYVDPIRMEAYNLSIETVSAIIAAENKNIPGGNFDVGTETYAVRVEGEFKDAKQMEQIVVGSYDGKNIYLKDVARVVDSVEERAQLTYNNGVQGAMIVIQKQTGANSVQISDKVMKALPDLQAALPSDVKLGIIVDTSDNIRNTISSLANTVRDALIFVGIVVFVFLGRWRSTVIILITIPLSLIASFIYLAITGSTLNIISLSSLSIAIGMVVDDAIVVLENVTTHIERGSEPKQAAVHGTNEVAISVIASTLTLLAVFFPLTMVPGMMGVMFHELGWMVTIIMIISTASALSLTPMLCSQLLKLNPKHSKMFDVLYGPIQKALDALDVAYAKLLDWSVRHRKTVVFAALSFFVLSMVLVKYVGTEFFPTSDDGRIGVTIETPIGTRTEISRDLALRVQQEWTKKYPEIKVLNFTVGQADTDNIFASMSDNGTHIISFNINLSDPGDRERGVVEICEMMREDLAAIPEIKKYQVNVGGSRGQSMGGQSTLDVEVYGYNFDETDRVATELKERLSKVKGMADITISRGDYQPEYQIDFDREKLALNGLNLSTAASYVRNRINGSIQSKYREDGEEYDIRVVYAPEYRQSVDAIENILVYNNQGKGVRIRDIGTVVERFAPPTIERKDRERINTVQGVIAGESMDKVVAGTREQIAQMDIPQGVTIKLAGSYEDQQESFGDLMTLMVLIILLVFIVMAAQFESLTYPFIIMFALPFSFSGVFMALFMTGTTMNVISMIGMIMLVGIVVKNGIVLVDYINLNRERGSSIIHSVVTGGKSRLRPVLMTTLTTILGMVPMAIGGGQGSETWQPMGISVIGGLTVSTLLTLVLVPVLYCMFAGTGVKRQRRKMRQIQAIEDLENSK